MKRLLTLATATLIASSALAAPPYGNGSSRTSGHFPHHNKSIYHADWRVRHGRVNAADWYADEAHRQTINAARLGCGYTGPRWRIDWNSHYRWALQTRPARLHREIDRRERGLAQCRRHAVRHHRRSPWR